jgi:hypothetical protein
MTTATATTFRIDPLRPTTLLCECCGGVACLLPAAAALPDQAEALTAQQAALAWPERADLIRAHTALCDWRRLSPKARAGV